MFKNFEEKERTKKEQMKKLTVLLALGVLAVAVRVVLAQPPEPIEKTGGVLWDGHSSADPYAQVENITCDDFKIYAYDLGGQQAVAYALLGVAATQAFTQSVTIEISAGYQTYFDTFQWERPITETVTVFWGACIGAVCRQGIETLSCGEEPTPTATATATPTSTPVPEVGTVLEISYSRSGRKISLAGVEVTAAVTVSWGLPHGTVVDHVGAGETKEANWPEDPGTQLGVTINGSWGLLLQGTVWPGERIYRIFLPVIAKAPLSTPTPTATPTVTPSPTPTPTPTPSPTPTPPPMPDPTTSLIKGWAAGATSTYLGYPPGKANNGDLSDYWVANDWAPQSWWAEGGPVELQEGVWLVLHQAGHGHVRGEVRITHVGGDAAFPFEGDFGDMAWTWIQTNLSGVTKVEVRQYQNTTSWPGLYEVVAK